MSLPKEVLVHCELYKSVLDEGEDYAKTVVNNVTAGHEDSVNALVSVLVGEVRDEEVVRLALDAAERLMLDKRMVKWMCSHLDIATSDVEAENGVLVEADDFATIRHCRLSLYLTLDDERKKMVRRITEDVDMGREVLMQACEDGVKEFVLNYADGICGPLKGRPNTLHIPALDYLSSSMRTAWHHGKVYRATYHGKCEIEGKEVRCVRLNNCTSHDIHEAKETFEKEFGGNLPDQLEEIELYYYIDHHDHGPITWFDCYGCTHICVRNIDTREDTLLEYGGDPVVKDGWRFNGRVLSWGDEAYGCRVTLRMSHRIRTNIEGLSISETDLLCV